MIQRHGGLPMPLAEVRHVRFDPSQLAQAPTLDPLAYYLQRER
jgi:hypothetical protein